MNQQKILDTRLRDDRQSDEPVTTVGVIGLGYWGPNLVRVFNENKRVVVSAVADTRSERCARIKTQYPGARIYSSAEELIESDVDAVAIATPLSTHFSLAMKALQRGKHVLLEKPFAASSEQARQLARMAAAQRRVIMVDHTFVYNPAVVRLGEMIAANDLGELLYFDSRRINLGLFQADADVVWDLAVHDFAILDRLVGDAPEAISAVGAAHLDGHPNNTAFITVRYPNQFVAHIDVNWLSPVKIRQLLIGGSKRMVIYDDLAIDNKVRIYDCGAEGLSAHDPEHKRRVDYRIGDMWAPHIPPKEPLAELAAHFIDCIRGRDKARTGPEAAIRVVRMLEAASESLRLGGVPVSLAAP
jgi:predicted dehydrogenase